MPKYCCDKFCKTFDSKCIQINENGKFGIIYNWLDDECSHGIEINYCPFCGKKLEDK